MRAQLTKVTKNAVSLKEAPSCRYLELLQRYKDLPLGAIVFKYHHDRKTFVRPLATPNGLSSKVLVGHRLDKTEWGTLLGETLCRVMEEGESFTILITSVTYR